MASKEVVELQNILKKIKNLRSKIDSLNDSEEREKLFQQIDSELATLEKKVNKKANGFTNEMTKVEYEIMLLENKLKVLYETYENLHNKSLNIFINQFFNSLTNDKNKIKSNFTNEINNIEKLQREIYNNKKELMKLKKKINYIRRAEELGLSYDEYKKIINLSTKKKVLISLLDKKELKEILNIPSNERTIKQVKELENARNIILATFTNNNKNSTNLDKINILFNIEKKLCLVNKPKDIKLSAKAITKIYENIENLPIKINNISDIDKSVEPLPLPEDMKSVEDKKKEEKLIKINEKIKELDKINLEENKTKSKEKISKINTKLEKIEKNDLNVVNDNLEKKEVKKKSKENKKNYLIYYDTLNNKYYAQENFFSNLNINKSQEFIKIEDINYFKIPDDLQEKIINRKTLYSIKSKKIKNDINNNYQVKNIILKLLSNLEPTIESKSSYKEDNIIASSSFKDELSSGKYIYNVVHISQNKIISDSNFLNQLSVSLEKDPKFEDIKQEISNRFNNLSKDEINILIKNYNTSPIKSRINNKINNIIEENIKNYSFN